MNVSTYFCECGLGEIDYMANHGLSDPKCGTCDIGMFDSTMNDDYITFTVDFKE